MNIRNRLNSLEQIAETKRQADLDFARRLGEAHDKYNHLPDSEAPEAWLKIKSLLYTAYKRMVAHEH